MRFLHVQFCLVSVRETELSLTCSVLFGQNGKALLRSVTTACASIRTCDFTAFMMFFYGTLFYFNHRVMH